MPPKSPPSSLLAALAVLAALLAPAPAHADDAIAELERDTPMSAYGGALAWSAYDPATKRYALVIRRDDVTTPARMSTSRRAFDVSLGPDSKGHVVALYTRCRTAARGCDVYRYDLRRRRESKLASVSSPSFDETWPAQWRNRIAFARRARTHVVDGYRHRPDPRGKGPLLDCDIPFVKTLSSQAPSRRLDRAACGATDGIAIRGATIVHVAGIDQGGAGSESQVRQLQARGGRARLLARTTGGEGGYSPFTSPSLSATAVWLTRTGRREGVAQGFLRIDLRSRRLTTIPADVTFGDNIARDERGTFWYVQGPQPDWDFESSCAITRDPCRLVRASADPFSATPRALLATLTVDGAAAQSIHVSAAEPLRLSGDLGRTIVRKGAVAGRQPLPGVALDLLRAASAEEPGAITPTGLTTTTDAAGRWSLTVGQPPPQFALLVVAPGLMIASAIVDVSASAKITLSANTRTLTGTVAPAQPGRSIAIQQLSVDAQGRPLGGGPAVCRLPPTAANCSEPAWATVAQAPLAAPGGTFSASVGGPGVYRARLAFWFEPGTPPGAYGGFSPAVTVAA